jgi:WD40 repeat protein
MAVAFSTDGRLLASGSKDGTVRLWEVATGQERANFRTHAQRDANGNPLPVLAVVFSPDGKLLASGGADKTVRLWDVATGNELGSLQHTDEVCSLAITPDGKLLASRTGDGVVVVWELAERKEVRRLEREIASSPFYSLRLAPDGSTLASNGFSAGTVKLYDVTTGERQRTLDANLTWQPWPISTMAFSPDGEVLAGTTLFSARMAFWNPNNGQHLGTIHFPGGTRCIEFSPDGKTIASAHGDGTVKLWDSAKLIPKK